MFFLMYLPLLGKFQLAHYTLFNLVIASIRGWTINVSSIERPQRLEDIANPDIATARRNKLIPWRLAIWGFRL